jgi:hypothetical protein
MSSQECTIDILRAEHDLGYRRVRTGHAGLAELSAAPAG